MTRFAGFDGLMAGSGGAITIARHLSRGLKRTPG